jgi:hypothetical protein
VTAEHDGGADGVERATRDPAEPDPEGRSALFGPPPPSSDGLDSLLAPPPAEGREALWSEGPRRSGTVVIECSSCGIRTRVALIDAGTRLAALSVLNPFRRHPHRLVCPACHEHTWCRIEWTG